MNPGLAYALAAYLTWGLVPIFWKRLGVVPAIEVLAHRVVWSLLFVGVLVVASGAWGEVKAAARQRKTLVAMAASTTLIACNWGLFIWAVQSGKILQTSIGYYINPLVNVLLGVGLLGERLRRPQALAVGLAALGVVWLAVAQHVFPWISLALAFSFGLYGWVRKRASVAPLVGLFIETALTAPLAIALLSQRAHAGTGAFGERGALVTLLLIATGPVTALPLVWFAAAAKRLTLTTLGFVQYLTPSLTLALAVGVYHERLTPTHMVTFGFIWAALALYTADGVLRRAPAERRRLA
jgi:chloramphenicol-sensitive protein RarD